MEILHYAALAIAGLAIGGHGNNKIHVVEEAAVRHADDLARSQMLKYNMRHH